MDLLWHMRVRDGNDFSLGYSLRGDRIPLACVGP